MSGTVDFDAIKEWTDKATAAINGLQDREKKMIKMIEDLCERVEKLESECEDYRRIAHDEADSE